MDTADTAAAPAPALTPEEETARAQALIDQATNELANRLAAGEVPIFLLGEEHVLRPTLLCAQALGQRYGGLSKPWDLLKAYDPDTYIFVVAAGLGQKPTPELAEKVFNTGLVALNSPLITFLGMLANGGKPMAASGGRRGNGAAGVGAA